MYVKNNPRTCWKRVLHCYPIKGFLYILTLWIYFAVIYSLACSTLIQTSHGFSLVIQLIIKYLYLLIYTALNSNFGYISEFFTFYFKELWYLFLSFCHHHSQILKYLPSPYCIIYLTFISHYTESFIRTETHIFSFDMLQNF